MINNNNNNNSVLLSRSEAAGRISLEILGGRVPSTRLKRIDKRG